MRSCPPTWNNKLLRYSKETTSRSVFRLSPLLVWIGPCCYSAGHNGFLTRFAVSIRERIWRRVVRLMYTETHGTLIYSDKTKPTNSHGLKDWNILKVKDSSILNRVQGLIQDFHRKRRQPANFSKFPKNCLKLRKIRDGSRGCGVRWGGDQRCRRELFFFCFFGARVKVWHVARDGYRISHKSTCRKS